MRSQYDEYGSLQKRMRVIAARRPGLTAKEMARMIGAKPDSVRTRAAQLGIRLTKDCKRLTWTSPMKQALLWMVLQRRSVVSMSEAMGMTENALIRGLCEIIRDGAIDE